MLVPSPTTGRVRGHPTRVQPLVASLTWAHACRSSSRIESDLRGDSHVRVVLGSRPRTGAGRRRAAEHRRSSPARCSPRASPARAGWCPWGQGPQSRSPRPSNFQASAPRGASGDIAQRFLHQPCANPRGGRSSPPPGPTGSQAHLTHGDPAQVPVWSVSSVRRRFSPGARRCTPGRGARPDRPRRVGGTTPFLRTMRISQSCPRDPVMAPGTEQYPVPQVARPPFAQSIDAWCASTNVARPALRFGGSAATGRQQLATRHPASVRVRRSVKKKGKAGPTKPWSRPWASGPNESEPRVVRYAAAPRSGAPCRRTRRSERRFRPSRPSLRRT